MEYGFKWLNNITDRIFNKYTPKGVGAVLVALALQHLGASDDVIKLAMSFEWTFVTDILLVLKTYATFFKWVSFALMGVGGYWIIKRNHDIVQLRNIELQAKQVEAMNIKKKSEIELAKLECELHNQKCDMKVVDIGLRRQIEEEKLLEEHTRAIIARTKADLELAELIKNSANLNKGEVE